MTKRKPPRINPPELLPDDEGDIETAVIVETQGLLTLRRFFVGVNLAGEDGSEQVFSLSPHFPSREAATDALSKWRDSFPGAGVLSVILCFDPSDPEHMERYGRMTDQRKSGRAH